MSWVVFDPEDALCLPPAALDVYSVHGWEVRADDPLCCFDDPLQQFPLSQGAVAIPHCDTAGEDTFNESYVGLGEWLMSKSGPLQQPDEMQPLLSSYHCCYSVFSPAKAL